ncbi:ACT domain-containing protein [Actinomadura craniellae]|uniref:amino acid-binding protein n=1 Tax=Actinomadura craniellae TaxID=2231787 RepID=UPI001F42E9B4|nr:amino acid-binding protein [Actinomadura craniellae]
MARILGVAGADVVQMAVLERDSGRALDDFTVAWPTGASIDRLCEGLASVPGVEIIGIWPTAEPQGAFPDAALVGQLASNPEDGLTILADAVPGILSADWAGLVLSDPEDPDALMMVHTSLGVFADIDVPEVHPLRARAFTGSDGTQYALAPIGGGTLVLLIARTGAPLFHRSEVFRLEQLVGAAEAVLGGGLAAVIGRLGTVRGPQRVTRS